MNNFFISGLPRSRTAWLANFLTFKNSYCYHELSKYGSNVYDLVAQLNKRKEDYVGTSDCGFPFYYEDIMKLLPNSKIVVIHRDVTEVKRSLQKFLGEWNEKLDDIVYKTLENTNKMIDDYEVMEVDYKDLSKMSTIKLICNYLTNGDTWDYERFRQLDETSVSLIKDKWFENLNLENISKLLGV